MFSVRTALIRNRALLSAPPINKKIRRDLFLKKKRKAGWGWQENHVSKKRGFLRNSRGQGLIEYLILVAIMGVSAIGIIRTLNQTVKSRFANAIYALQGRNQKATTHNMRKEEYQRSDLSNFMSGAASTDKKTRGKKKKR